MNLFDLAAKITLDSSQYESGIKEAESTGKGFSEKLKSGLGTAAKIGGASVVALGAAAVAVGKKLYSEASDLAVYGDQIDKNSQKMGISAQAYQEWDFILQHSGSSIDAMGRGMMTLSKQAESNSDAFARLGITQEDLATLNKEDLFAKTIEGLQALGEGTERDALAAQLFGGSAKELGPLLNTSAKEVAAMRKQVNDLGGVMSNKAVKDAAKFQDSLQDMKTAFDGIKRNLTSQFLPSFSSVFKNLAGILTSSGKDAEKYQKGLAKNFGKIASDLVKQIPNIAKTAGKIGLSLIDSLSSTLTKNAGKFIRSGLNVIKELASGLISRIPDLMGDIGSIIGDIITNIPNIIELAFNIVKGLAEGIILGIPKYLAGIGEGFKGLFSKPISEDVQIALDRADDIREKYSDLYGDLEEMRDNFAQVDADAAEAEHWLGVFDTLSGKASLTKDEQIKLNTAVEKLNELMPDLGLTVDEETGKWNLNTQAIQDNIDAMKHRAMADIYTEKAKEYLEKIAELNIEIKEEEKNLGNLTDRHDRLNAKIDEAKRPYDNFYNNLTAQREALGRLEFTWGQGTDAMREYAESLGITEDSFVSWGNVLQTGSGQLQDWRDDLADVDRQIEISKGTIKGLEFGVESLEKQVDKFYDYADQELSAAAKMAERNGNAVADGFANGIKARESFVRGAAGGLTKAAMDEMKKVAMIASPSKRARKEVGEMIGKGLSIGLEGEIRDVERASEKLSNAAMPDAISGGGYDYRSSPVETKPERPIYLVLDSGELVGRTVRKYDEALGTENALKLRFGGAMA